MINCNLLIPIFNIEVDESLLNKELFDGYSIIRSSDILFNKEKYIFDNYSFTKSFISDITENGPNKLLAHPYAKFVIHKRVLIKNDDKTLNKARIHYDKEIDKIILALRLASNGYCQINNIYTLAPGYSAFSQCDSSTQIENITINHRTVQNNIIVENLYHLTPSILKEIKKELNTIKKLETKNVYIPISYFHRCYDSKTPADKILNLAIVLESTMLAGRNQELNYRLYLRTSALLEKDVKELLETFYNLRSEIIHNGTVPDFLKKKDIYKKLAKITGIECKDCTELIFYFIKDHIEPITREILQKSFKIFTQNKEIQTYEMMNSNIEKFIMNKITKDFKI